ncbi:MAG: hypothetical protein HRU69_03875 [Flammeovirgaceae bacterium]|nr:MAG: hypothetical protein HRU69_03875 [Flammeovirgaceae bacterium]
MKGEPAKVQLRRARATALAFGLATVFSLLMLVYAIIKKNEADAMRVRVNQLEMQLEVLKKEAALQQGIAEAERQRVEENYRKAVERLEAAEAKKLK